MSVVNFKSDQRISKVERVALREHVSQLGNDVAKLANRLGVKVFAKPLDNSTSGVLEYAPSCGSESGFRIVVNSNEPVERQKFTAAHELGHFVLHRNDPSFKKKFLGEDNVYSLAPRRDQDRSSYDPDELVWEREADAFAVELLLPRHLVKDCPDLRWGAVEHFAARYRLSRSLVANRFEELRSRYGIELRPPRSLVA